MRTMAFILGITAACSAGVDDAPTLFRPIALALDGETLLAANRDSGSLSVIDTKDLSVIRDQKVGKRLSSIAVADATILVTDEETGDLITLQRGTLKELGRTKAGMTPVSVRASRQVATVALLWPRRLLIVPLEAGTPEAVDLPFAPRVQLMIPGTTKVIVADSFGGGLAVVDFARKSLESIRFLPVHNIRGLALDPERKTLLVAHQVLSARGRTTGGEIQTSNVLTNNVRKVPLATIVDPVADLHRDEQVYQLGGVDRGAGDPTEIHQTPNGDVLVTLAGVNEIAIGRPEQVIWSLIPIGRRPTAMVVDDARQRAYIANTFDDSISIVDLSTRKAQSISLRPAGRKPVELTAEQRGERHFFDARLSFESWFSCHSCHPEGHTNGRLNDNFSDGSFGTPKRVLSLLGTKDTAPYAWNGAMKDLEAQIRSSLKTTMQGPGLPPDAMRDLAAYLRTLPAPPPLAQARGNIDADAVRRGRKVFAEQKCATCHPGPAYTTPKTFDVGLKDEAGNNHFNPPSLRGISQAGPYFHDGRAHTLDEVFTRFGHQLSRQLLPREVSDLVSFLGSL